MAKGKTAKPVDPAVLERAQKLSEAVRSATNLDELWNAFVSIFADPQSGPVAFKGLNLKKLPSFGGRRPKSTRVISWDNERALHVAEDGSFEVIPLDQVPEDDTPPPAQPQRAERIEPEPSADEPIEAQALREGNTQDSSPDGEAAPAKPAAPGPDPETFATLLAKAFELVKVTARRIKVKVGTRGAALSFETPNKTGKNWRTTSTTLPLLLWRDAGPELASQIAEGVAEGMAEA